ncbi:NADH dehydrogenase subunit G [Legionella geestiana]|uniref:NADH-quinone oxidoreductase n=1 Tax=Legionella geestiana TaxID=45065 RepID=A0A0W0U8H7_9GAMM|nr:NADH-quinone oxidoreductase subunit NuoG [Legionella geestiana]KTD04090.1 NADH dehydrogenase subunit G [Legionella geestiana]QBS12102.1 NADH-quinone oxidoreductase subunit G [Legionella geestiana]QDQ40290.1 NADH-quinone oxidoreductase subunit G [Legionella geestiana]STX53175.1 NADH dehydrogenase I chain G [Legionella geestiana]
MATIEIDGKTCEAENGKMIIEVADDAGIYIPRFCYHKKLSVAANCRMCLVEVENGRKPVPACATPITNGMKVFTKSEEAIRSQKAVMEFLLINHPLDCPICDQGGECELQDLSMGFGADMSGYDESKRSVDDDNLGKLIATEMTRCIHCTRCVRFGEEIAGVRELGATGRGEKTQIGTFVEHSMTSEISGNIIDLCPVGALTSRPYRFTARSWELQQHESIAPHDCLGSNIYLHVRRNQLMRVVPRECEPLNETWLSDRDRFSYLGVNSEKRAQQPMIKRNGQWESVDWEQALKFAAEGTSRVIEHHGPEQFAAFASPSSSLEEMYLLQKLMRAMGVNNLDHRLHQTDFSDQAQRPVLTKNSAQVADLESASDILVLGSNLVREVPLAAARMRKAVRNGAQLAVINPVDYDLHCDVHMKAIASPQDMPHTLAALVLATAEASNRLDELSDEVRRLTLGVHVSESIREIAASLSKPEAIIITGALFENHPHASLLRALLSEIVRLSGAKDMHLSTGSNAAGAQIAGMVPHRGAAAAVLDAPGLDAQASIEARLKGYWLMGVEPGFDFANPHAARQAMLGAEFVVVMSAFVCDSMKDYANVILPMALSPETSGTWINVNNTWQSVKGALTPPGEARPGWKILRVLGNILQCRDFEYVSSDEILREVQSALDLLVDAAYQPIWPEALPVHTDELVRVGEWPIYRVDATVRHATALQHCASADEACVRMHPETANRLKLQNEATVSQGNIKITLPLKRDERVAPDVVWVPNAMPETVDLGHAFAGITITC